jgi:hypothetical protein
MDDVTLLQDPIVLAALATWAADDVRADVAGRMAAAYSALVAANMWPASLGNYAGLSDDDRVKLWQKNGILKQLPTPGADVQTAAKDLYQRLYTPPVASGFGEQIELVKAAKRAALLAQLAAMAKAPDALTRAFQAAGAMYTSGAWTLMQHAAYLAKSDQEKLALWANGTPYKAAWGLPTPAEQQAAVDTFRSLYAQQISDGEVQDPVTVGGKPSKNGGGNGGGSGIGTIVLGAAGLWLLSKIFGGR